MHFPCDEVYHKMGIWWKKKGPCYGKSMSTSFPGSPHMIGFVTFSCTMENLWGNPCISHLMKYTIRWESDAKNAPILWEQVWASIFQTFPIPWVLLHFPVLWRIYGETHASPIWWHWLVFSCQNYIKPNLCHIQDNLEKHFFSK